MYEGENCFHQNPKISRQAWVTASAKLALGKHNGNESMNMESRKVTYWTGLMPISALPDDTHEVHFPGVSWCGTSQLSPWRKWNDLLLADHVYLA